MMRLLVDGQALQADHVKGRGIGRYTSNFLDGLLALPERPEIDLVLHDHLPSPDFVPNQMRVIRYSPLPYTKTLTDTHDQQLKEHRYGKWLDEQNADWVLIPNPMDYDLLVPRFDKNQTKVCAIHYDLIPFLFHTVYLKSPGYFQAYAGRLRQVLAMDLLLSISETSTKDLVRYFPETQGKVVTISGATDPCFAKVPDPSAPSLPLREQLRLDRDSLFHLGGPEPRKNLDGAIRALGYLVNDHHKDLLLVLVCNPHSSEKAHLEKLARECGVSERLRLLPRMNDQELRWLYENCRVFLFPSYYEGLGLPILEAQQVGAPVAVSNASSLPEFAGPGAELFDPALPVEIAESVKRLLEKPREAGQTARREFANQFSWEKTALLAMQSLRTFEPKGAPKGQPKAAILIPPEFLTTMELDNLLANLLAIKDEYSLELVIDTPLNRFPKKLADSFPILRSDEFENRLAMGIYNAAFRYSPSGGLSDVVS